jgi:serine/threonine protein kinase
MKNTGGRVLASGGFGCVFSPALKCEGETKRSKGKISKLMSEKHATEEYQEIVLIKNKLDNIKHYKDYFLINDITLCQPAKLSSDDLTYFSSKCTALPKDKITKANINNKLDKLMSLNVPHGGLPVDDFLYQDGSFEKIYKIHTSLVKLLKKGIVQMNDKHVYHCDIKDSNVLLDDNSNELKARLIDWGLTTEYIPFKNNNFPSTWRNRPFQFNVPFSVIIFSDSFVEKYTKYLSDGGLPEETQLKPFVIDYINIWMKERGAGHYKFINEIMYTLFHNILTSIPEKSKPNVIETQITMDFMVNYIVNVLVHFTKFKPDGSLNLREYLDKVFIKIVDIWGFITIYFPIIELLSNNYNKLTKHELKIFEQLRYMFVEYLYTPRHEIIDMNILYYDLKKLGDLIYQNYKGIQKISSESTSSINKSVTTKSNKSIKTKSNKSVTTESNKAEGIHNNNNNNNKRSLTRKNKSIISFKRKTKQKRFKKPLFLSLK